MIATTTIHLSTTAIAMATGWAIPLVVAWITKADAPGWVKGAVALFLSSLSGCLVAVSTGGGDLQPAVFGVAVMHSFELAVVSHFGIWKPAGLTGANGSIARHTATFGIGGGHGGAEAQV